MPDHQRLRSFCSKAASLTYLVLPMSLVPMAGAQTQHSADLDTAKSLMAQGLAAANHGDLELAKRDFAKVVRLVPQIETGHAAYGSILLALGDAKTAAKELELAHKLEPDDLATTLNLARDRVELRDFPQAVSLFQSVFGAPSSPSLSPDETVAYSTALTAIGRPEKAISLLEDAAVASPNSAQLQDTLGTVLAFTKRLDLSVSAFQRAVSLDPSLGIAFYHLAAALLQLDRGAEAISPAQRAAALLPDSFDTQLLLGRALSTVHRDQEALVALRRSASLHPETHQPQAIYSLALALQASGDPQTALPLFALALAHQDADPTFSRSDALTNYALCRVQTGDADGALPIYKEALALGPDTPSLREDLGAAYLQKADLNDAITQFTAGLALEPNNPQLHYDLGLAYKLKDDLASAVPEFERAAALNPDLPDPAYTLGVIYMQQGKFPEATQSLRRATNLQPDNGEAWALLGSVLKDSSHPDEAQVALRRAIELQPDQPNLHIQLATLESQAGQKDQAAADRRIAAELSRAATNRQRAGFALKSGRSLIDQNKLDDAVVQLTVAVQADPALAEPHTLLAEIYSRQGKAAEAALERKRALQLTPALTTSH